MISCLVRCVVGEETGYSHPDFIPLWWWILQPGCVSHVLFGCGLFIRPTRSLHHFHWQLAPHDACFGSCFAEFVHWVLGRKMVAVDEHPGQDRYHPCHSPQLSEEEKNSVLGINCKTAIDKQLWLASRYRHFDDLQTHLAFHLHHDFQGLDVDEDHDPVPDAHHSLD